MDERSRSNEIIITAADCVFFVKKHIRFVRKWSAIVASFILLITLFSPLQYTYEVKIKVPENKMGGEGSLKEMIPLLGQSSPTEGVVALLGSHMLLQKVIGQMGVQVHCEHRSFVTNLMLSLKQSLLFGLHKESFFDADLFSFRDVSFSGEKPLSLFLRCSSKDQYELVDQEGKVLGSALVDQALEFPFGSLTLSHLPHDVEFGKLYPCRFNPLAQEISDWQKKTQIRIAKFDKTILDFRLVDSDRHRSKQFLDHLLLVYQDWKKKEQSAIYEQQLSYLRQKTEEITESFRGELVQHRKYLQESLMRYGTLGYTEEIESLMQSKHGYKTQLLDIALDLKRVEEMERNEQGSEPARLYVQTSQPSGGQFDLPIERHKIELPLQELTKFNSKIISDCLGNCIREQEKLEEEKEKLSLLLQGMVSPDFELSSLSSVFVDQTVQNLLLKVQALSLQIKDKDNLSVREQERLVEMMSTYRGSLMQQLSQAISLKQGQIDALKIKILHWRALWKEVLVSEKRLLQEQLAEITQSMSALPDKWYYETLLDMRQEQCKEALKGLEQMRFAVHANLQPLVCQLQVLDGEFLSNRASSLPFWQKSVVTFVLTFFSIYFALFMRLVFATPVGVKRDTPFMSN